MNGKTMTVTTVVREIEKDAEKARKDSEAQLVHGNLSTLNVHRTKGRKAGRK